MKVIQKLRMDLARCGPRPVVAAVQGEANTRVLEVSLYDNSVAWEIPAAAVVDVAYQKPDGTQGVYSRLPDGSPATSFSGNVLSATLAPQMLTCAGPVLATFVFSKDGEKTLAAFPFTITVTANPAAGAERSEDYFNPKDLSDLMAEITAHTARRDNPHGVTAAQVGARPNTWLPTIADIGAAPAGYGLGVEAKTVNDIDNIVGTGWFYGTPKIDGFVFGNSIIHHYENSGYSVQEAKLLSATTGTGCDNTILRREKYAGVWQPWEWIDPPMLIGTEYRTTERFNGKPVYTQAFSLGTGCSAGSVKDVEHGIANVQYLISCQGFTNYPAAMPCGGFLTTDHTIVTALAGYIRICSTVDTTGSLFYAILKYTKTTD